MSIWQSLPRHSHAQQSMLEVCWLTAISKIIYSFFKGKGFGEITLQNDAKISLAYFYAALLGQQLVVIYIFQNIVVFRGS